MRHYRAMAAMMHRAASRTSSLRLRQRQRTNNKYHRPSLLISIRSQIHSSETTSTLIRARHHNRSRRRHCISTQSSGRMPLHRAHRTDHNDRNHRAAVATVLLLVRQWLEARSDLARTCLVARANGHARYSRTSERALSC